MWKSPRIEAYPEGEADEARQLKLDSVEEARINALTQSTRYHQGDRHYHDCNVQQRSFSVGDMVLRCIQDEIGLHKVNSRWEGPFIVSKVTRPGSLLALFSLNELLRKRTETDSSFHQGVYLGYEIQETISFD